MRRYIVLLFSLVLIGIDQLTKNLVIDNIRPIGTYPIIQDVLHFTYHENTGAAFSSFQGASLLLIGFTSVALLIAVAYVCWGKKSHPMVLWSLSAIIGGGMGNLLDRVLKGYVVDFIDVRIINFAVFNFADMCICIGTAFLIAYIIFFESKKNDKTEQTQEDPE